MYIIKWGFDNISKWITAAVDKPKEINYASLKSSQRVVFLETFSISSLLLPHLHNRDVKKKKNGLWNSTRCGFFLYIIGTYVLNYKTKEEKK